MKTAGGRLLQLGLDRRRIRMPFATPINNGFEALDAD